MDISEIARLASEFKKRIAEKKAAMAPAGFPWYPYDTLGIFSLLDALLTGKHRFLLELIGDKPTVDIGAQDGDLAFFMESLGCKVHVLDNGPTNMNGLQGARLLKKAFSSSVQMYEIDLNAQFKLPDETYGVAFFLGILYHLKNPYFALETLAKRARYALISTRVAKFSARSVQRNRLLDMFVPDPRVRLEQVPVAYLLDELEANNDSTNYWIFSEAGLRRILKRTGWELCEFKTVGDTINSDPASGEGDERAICLARSGVCEA